MENNGNFQRVKRFTRQTTCGSFDPQLGKFRIRYCYFSISVTFVVFLRRSLSTWLIHSGDNEVYMFASMALSPLNVTKIAVNSKNWAIIRALCVLLTHLVFWSVFIQKFYSRFWGSVWNIVLVCALKDLCSFKTICTQSFFFFFSFLMLQHVHISEIIFAFSTKAAVTVNI